MKSLSLDCAEMPPPVSSQSPFKAPSAYGGSKGGLRAARVAAFTASNESSEWERSMSPSAPPVQRRQLPLPAIHGTHVVIHEYITSPTLEHALFLGDRLHVVDNGDPDWRHGFKINDPHEELLTFPSTCVAAYSPTEQPMKLNQNVNLTEFKLRLYRDQVVFAQPDSIKDGRILVRNEHKTFAYCPLQFLMLL